VLVATRPVDFRKGMGGLAALVKDQFGYWQASTHFLDPHT
jgi:hypothetical protein